ncbi:unnamed protein product [Cyprideis torosa]|uniref:Uncharacterized protein n=1 Tax=Cyprideis torosa TaxID=163714 RepID=A0A7R8ZMG1_9CRUS|nr:unnamed protein product [Cyprideis torosa]CAG0884258.1 unnamed protein product [Cyprideis torosa]
MAFLSGTPLTFSQQGNSHQQESRTTMKPLTRSIVYWKRTLLKKAFSNYLQTLTAPVPGRELKFSKCLLKRQSEDPNTVVSFSRILPLFLYSSSDGAEVELWNMATLEPTPAQSDPFVFSSNYLSRGASKHIRRRLGRLEASVMVVCWAASKLRPLTNERPGLTQAPCVMELTLRSHAEFHSRGLCLTAHRE